MYEPVGRKLEDRDVIEIEVIDEVYLNAKELRTVRLSMDFCGSFETDGWERSP